MMNIADNPHLHKTVVSRSTLFWADCFDVFPLIADKSVDAIIADLPYGTTACKWDSVLNLTLLWCQYGRIMKENGVVVLTASQPFTTELIISAKDIFRYSLVWEKSHGSFATAKKMPLKRHEDILVFSNGKETYNPQMTEREKVRDRRKEGYMLSGKGNSEHSATNPNIPFKYADDYNPKLAYPKSVLKYPNPSDKRNHPTEKPIELMEWTVKTYTNENEIVLDNTMGSGTTGLACLKTNRQFIGIEKEKQYYDVAVRRLSEYCG